MVAEMREAKRGPGGELAQESVASGSAGHWREEAQEQGEQNEGLPSE